MKMRWISACATLAVIGASAPGAAQQIIGIGTNPQGSFTYPVGAAMAKVIQEKAGITSRVQPSAGSSTNIPLLNRGELELVLVTVEDNDTSFTGTGEFEGKPNPNIRLIGVMFPLPVAMLVMNASPYKRVVDLKGQRISSDFPSQTTGRKLTEAILASGGVAYSDVIRVPAKNLFEGAAHLGQSRVDGAVIGVGSAQVQQVHVETQSRGGVRYLSIDDTPQAAIDIKKHYRGGYTEVFQPAPGLPGVVGPTRVLSFSEFVITHHKISEETIYRITKTLYENKEALGEGSPPLRRFDPRLMAEANLVPYHPGAEKFYREVGLWPPKER